MKKGDARNYLGVSLGGGRGKTTAVARLQWREDGSPLVLVEARVKQGHRGSGWAENKDLAEGDGASLGYFRDELLLAYLQQWPADASVLAVDVPLTMPPCVGCERACPGLMACEVEEVVWMREQVPRLSPRAGKSDPDKPAFSPYTERASDALARALAQIDRSALGPTMGPRSARAQFLQQALGPKWRRGHNLVEVAPRVSIRAALGTQLELRTRRGTFEELWAARIEVLSRMIQRLRIEGVWPELVARNVHVFSALVSAWLAWRWDLQGRPRRPTLHRNRGRVQPEELNEALAWCYWDESPLDPSVAPPGAPPVDPPVAPPLESPIAPSAHGPAEPLQHSSQLRPGVSPNPSEAPAEAPSKRESGAKPGNKPRSRSGSRGGAADGSARGSGGGPAGGSAGGSTGGPTGGFGSAPAPPARGSGAKGPRPRHLKLVSKDEGDEDKGEKPDISDESGG